MAPRAAAAADLIEPPPHPILPRRWPLEQREYIEFEKAKADVARRTFVAIQQLGTDQAERYDSLGESVQSLHGRIGTIEKKIDGVGTDVGFIRSQVHELASMFGGLMRETMSGDVREKLESLHEEGQQHAEAIVEQGEVLAQQKALIQRAHLQAEKAKIDAEKAKVEAEVATARADMSDANARQARADSAAAKKLAAWRVMTLVSVGIALYKVFEVIEPLFK